MVTDERLDLEFAYTSHDISCRNPLNIEQYCRRPRYHEGDHASGFGAGRRRWERDPIEEEL